LSISRSAPSANMWPVRMAAGVAGATSQCGSAFSSQQAMSYAADVARGPRRLADLADWQRHVGVLPSDEDVAMTWGQLQARAQRRGRPRPVNDTWIAACRPVHRLPLAIFKTRDFADFAQYDGLN
jgi:predicted nucleic acid-binding protein